MFSSVVFQNFFSTWELISAQYFLQGNIFIFINSILSYIIVSNILLLDVLSIPLFSKSNCLWMLVKHTSKHITTCLNCNIQLIVCWILLNRIARALLLFKHTHVCDYLKPAPLFQFSNFGVLVSIFIAWFGTKQRCNNDYSTAENEPPFQKWIKCLQFWICRKTSWSEPTNDCGNIC